MSTVYQVVRSAGPNRPEYTRAEVVASSEPILSRKNEKIPWEWTTDHESASTVHDPVLQTNVVPLDNYAMKNWLAQRNKNKGQPEWVSPPFGNAFKDQNDVIRSLYEGTNVNLTVHCPFDEQARFMPDTEIEHVNSTDEECKEYMEAIWNRDMTSRKDKPKSPKESAKDMLRRLLHEKAEKVGARVSDDVYRDTSGYDDVLKSRKQKFFQNLNEEILDLMKKEKKEYEENLAANNNALNAIGKGTRFAMETDPECDYPRWVRHLYRVNQKEIGQHITRGMGVMDWQTDPKFELKMAAVRGAILSGQSYGPSAVRSAHAIPPIYLDSRRGTGVRTRAIHGSLADLETEGLTQALKKQSEFTKKRITEHKFLYSEREGLYNSLMERGIVDCKLMRYIDKSVLLDLAKIRRNSKNIFPDTRTSVDEYSLDIAERFLQFEMELMKDNSYKFDMSDHDPWAYEFKEDGDAEIENRDERDSDEDNDENKNRAAHSDAESVDKLSDTINIATPAQNFRKFDLAKYLQKKDRVKKTEKKSKVSIPSGVNKGLPKFLPSEPCYPTDKNQDEYCMRRFRDLLDNRGYDKVLKGWRYRLLARRLATVDCNK